MDTTERAALLARLESGKKAILDALDGIADEVAKRLPAEGKWSILECVEHLAVSEEFMFAQILNAVPSETPAVNRERESGILTRGADRAKAFQSPEAMQPKGRFPTISEALQHFLAAHERTARFVEKHHGDLRSQITLHPMFGRINCYENLLLIAVHPLRHAKQIEQCKAVVLKSRLNN